MRSDSDTLARVTRTKAQAKASYDRMSSFYDLFSGGAERKLRAMALDRLQVARGETVLEIGFGTGHCLEHLAGAVGEEGRVYGLDISSGMLAASLRRLERAGLAGRVELTCQDAVNMPYPGDKFEAVFMSFALELFDTPEIPLLLAETRRVLKPGGRLGVIGMSKEGGAAPLLKLYEWLHRKLPQTVDCRPMHVAQSIQAAGFGIRSREMVNLMGLPAEIVIGVKPGGTD